MTDDPTLDEALAEVVALSSRIAAKDPEDPARLTLERQRDQLRSAIRSASDASRSDAALHNELGMLRRRLEQIDDRPIGKGWAEKGNYRWVNDPGAYSGRINEMLEAQDAHERAEIVLRVAEIEKALSPPAD